ncbi:hypothetical protein [Clostridium cuniculi]|nr:hypothetical protein [Clostridium cuniculi]
MQGEEEITGVVILEECQWGIVDKVYLANKILVVENKSKKDK